MVKSQQTVGASGAIANEVIRPLFDKTPRVLPSCKPTKKTFGEPIVVTTGIRRTVEVGNRGRRFLRKRLVNDSDGMIELSSGDRQ